MVVLLLGKLGSDVRSLRLEDKEGKLYSGRDRLETWLGKILIGEQRLRWGHCREMR